MPAKPARGRSAARVGRRAQIDAEESMAECIAEVDDVTAGLDAEEGRHCLRFQRLHQFQKHSCGTG